MRDEAGTAVTRFWWLQALAVSAWWLWLWQAPTARGWFAFGDWPDAVLTAFVAPDALVLVVGSIVATRTCGRRRVACAWLLVGAATYATLWCASAALLAGAGWLGCAMMAVCALANVVAAATVAKEPVR